MICRSSHEERGLKYIKSPFLYYRYSRSSHEERGLKLGMGGVVERHAHVAPRMRSVD